MDVRHALSKHGGNLGIDGSVVFMFKHCGSLIYEPGTSEDKVMEAALEAGAEDIVVDDEDGSIEVITPPNDFMAVKEALENAGLKAVVAEVIMKPNMETIFTGDDALKMQKILDMLEDLDDVQDVYTTAVIED
jgi:transcriptional/translational regulatory protein YebC/TACO1